MAKNTQNFYSIKSLFLAETLQYDTFTHLFLLAFFLIISGLSSGDVGKLADRLFPKNIVRKRNISPKKLIKKAFPYVTVNLVSLVIPLVLLVATGIEPTLSVMYHQW